MSSKDDELKTYIPQMGQMEQMMTIVRQHVMESDNIIILEELDQLEQKMNEYKTRMNQ